MKVYACVWMLCHKCKAPSDRPLPEGWTYVVRRMPHGIDRVTPHKADCPHGFKKVHIPDVD